MTVGEECLREEGFWPETAFGESRSRNEKPGIGVRIRKRMNVTSQIPKTAGLPITIDDEIGLIERLVVPQRDRDKLKLGAMCNIRKPANPCRIELPDVSRAVIS